MEEYEALCLGNPRRMDDTVTPIQLHTKSKKTVKVAQERGSILKQKQDDAQYI
jgi:hypothetical protein